VAQPRQGLSGNSLVDVQEHIYFRQTSLYNTLVTVVILAGGLGLIARSLRPQKAG
jgi:hypothetical protein